MAKRRQAKKRKQKSPDYDTAWKTVIEEHFEHFLAFFFPEIHQDIDFSRKPEIKSNELLRIVPQGKIGKRRADVLIKNYLKDGSQKCICIFMHVEIQGTRKTGFMKRIFTYYYRIFEKYMEKGVEIISLAILTDEDKNYRPNKYHFKRWGFEHLMKIPMVKIIDYKIKKKFREKLETSTNPFALAVKVQLKSHEAKNLDDASTYNIKRELMREYYNHGYDARYVRSLLHFMDLIFHLPEDLEKKFTEEILRIEEELNMPYVTNVERIAIKKGMKEGKKEGKKEGMKEGMKEGKLETAREFLKLGVDIDTVVKATGFSKEEIEKIAETIH